jgi:alcohol dehydrogenase class IV
MLRNMNQAPFNVSRDIYIGSGIRAKLGELLEARGVKKALMVYDKGLSNTDIPGKVAAELDKAGIAHDAFFDLAGEPVYDTLYAIVDKAKEFGAEAFVAIGGGSAIDSCKGARTIYCYGEDVTIDHLLEVGVPGQPLPTAPLVIMPTTAGTGSEATEGTMVSWVDPETGEHWKKILENRPNRDIDFSLVDPELACGSPVRVSMSCAFDVLAQCWENVLSQFTSPFMQDLAHCGIRHFANSCQAIYDDPNNLEAREEMALGCLQVGISMNCSYLGMGHAFGHAIGSVKGLPHGYACGVFIPAVMDYHKDKETEKMLSIAADFDWFPEEGEDPIAFLDRFIKWLHDFAVSVGVDIKDTYATPEECYAIIPQALADYSWRIGPCELTEEVAKQIINKAYEF